MEKQIKRIMTISLLVGTLTLTATPLTSFANETPNLQSNMTSRCASCLQPRYVSHKFTTKSNVYLGTEVHTRGTIVNFAPTGSEIGSIQIGASYSISRTFKKYKVVYDSSVTIDYYNSMGQFVKRATTNRQNLVRYDYFAK
ncbi:MAG: hypothetical protein ACRDCC_02035 [Culicoidibacterales bacterium]